MSDPTNEADKDALERDEFAERLRRRDAENSAKKSAVDREVAEILAMDDDPARRSSMLSQRREKSSQSYLSKREGERVLLYSKKLEDEERLFEGIAVTEAERMRFESNKQILSAVEERKRLKVEQDAYLMPTSTTA